MINPIDSMFKIIIIITSMLLGSCTAAAITTGGIITGTGIGAELASEERSIAQSARDTAILAEINNSFMKQDFDNLFGVIDVEVYNGVVLLTGQVKTQEFMIQAIDMSWKAKNVKEVINELQVSEGTNFIQYTKDVSITGQAKTRLLLDKNIRSSNYNIVTVNGVIYVLGLAQNEEELYDVTQILSTISGVSSVVSHVTVPSYE